VTINEIAEILISGNVAAFPTETVYGLGAIAMNPEAVKRIFQLKGRPSDNPLIVHISKSEQLTQFTGKSGTEADLLIRHFWPGPLTLVFEKKADVPDVVTGGMHSVAVRMPGHPLALKLIEKTGPLVAPSANKSGRPSPTKPEHVYEDFGKGFPVLEGGQTKIGIESTVLDVRSKPFKILRPGKIEAEEISRICGVKVIYDSSDVGASPGVRYTHYKPKARVIWQTMAGKVDEPCYFLTHSATPPKSSQKARTFHFRDNLGQMAVELYDIFRSADQNGYGLIVIEDFRDDDSRSMARALKNRIEKAIVG